MDTMNRRGFVALTAAAAAGCGRQRASAYEGYAFVANEQARTVAAVSLAAFSVARQIPIDGSPTAIAIDPVDRAVAVDPTKTFVYALAGAEGALFRISASELAVRDRIALPGPAAAVRLAEATKSLWFLSKQARLLIPVDLAKFAVGRPIPLENGAADFDIDATGQFAAVSYASGKIALVDLKTGRVGAGVSIGQSAGVVRFRHDSLYVLAGNPAERLLTIIERERGEIVVHLPLAVKPENFCFNHNFGQLFITGEGMDAVAIIYPYETQVAETVLAGHTPGYMSASSDPPALLFVANTASGEVTTLSIDSRRVIAVTQVGREPSCITITPDNQYALVLNRSSGDMAVMRLGAITGRRTKSAPLFTMIPVGSRPVGVVVT